MFSPLFVKQHN